MDKASITWVDSCAAGGQWETVEDAVGMRPNECETVGFLLYRDAECAIVAESVSGHGDAVVCLNIVSIPAGCIKGIRFWDTEK